MKHLFILTVLAIALLMQSCIITQEYTIHNDLSGSQNTIVDFSSISKIIPDAPDSLTHEIDSLLNEKFSNNNLNGLSNYKYGMQDGKYTISFDYDNLTETTFGLQFTKQGNKILINFNKIEELITTLSNKDEDDKIDFSTLFQYTAIFNFDKKVLSVTGIDAQISGKKTVKVPIKINSFPKENVVITLK